MTDEARVLAFSEKLCRTAEILKESTVVKRGQKAISKRARAELTEIKKEITPIKKITMEN